MEGRDEGIPVTVHGKPSMLLGHLQVIQDAE